ncbi:hypothetical protein BJ138DRAFT_1118789 [Hygrophoropsis aurantiaca]|uniref:Uncharacterized protein n=1 Tax=Hygrophoropsis aurantiaca TaxID=72124 RepID=A0ACB7ZVJ6_9AGAM|nr:hypothetical protein BJ138DRAFT_1118789 [Hygrophoropsis aurantiaca]
MLMGEFDTPKDLNLIVPHGQFTGMQRFLLRSGYQEIADPDVQDDMAKYIHSFHMFQGDNETITLSEAKGPDVLEIVVNSPTTADMTCMTAGGVTTLYPEMTLAWKAVVTPSGRWEQLLGSCFGSINAGRFNLYDDMSFTNQPCESSCPSLWRLPRTDESILAVNWDERYSIYPALRQCKTEWRLSKVCVNSRCQNSVNVRKDGPTFVQKDMPDTMYDVRDRTRDIEAHQPAFVKGFKGILYATRGAEPIIVDVPLIEGAKKIKAVEDLYVECWVRQRGHDDTSTRRAKLRRTYYTIPNLESVPLDFAYTFFSEEGDTNPPINALVNKMSPPRPKSPYIHGNFLVIKHDMGSKGELRDACDKDISVVNTILRSLETFISLKAMLDGRLVDFVLRANGQGTFILIERAKDRESILHVCPTRSVLKTRIASALVVEYEILVIPPDFMEPVGGHSFDATIRRVMSDPTLVVIFSNNENAVKLLTETVCQTADFAVVYRF